MTLGWALLAAPPNTPSREALLLWHRSLGLVILAAMLFRWAWRWRHPPPPLPQAVARPVAALARTTHLGLYALLIALPVAGYLNAAAAGHAVSLFGLLAVPPLLPRNARLSQAAVALHLAGQYLLYVLLMMHVAGALYHALLRRDGVFTRMLPGMRAISAGRPPQG